MNCLSCKHKKCKTEGKDCTDMHDLMVDTFSDKDNLNIYLSADKLISNGMAGTLSRVEEIALYCREMDIKTIGIAYCFAMEELGTKLQQYLKQQGFKVKSYRCTIGGVKENEIQEGLSKSVSCNPVGQALIINKEDSDFIIEMGLCLGHDVIFHKHLKKPFTVLFVKDRVYNHCPQKFFDKQ